MEDTFSFAKRLVAARNAAGLNQKALIEKLDGAAQSTVSKWETGESEPSVESIRKLAKAIGCTADYLVGATSWPTPLPPSHWVIDLDREDMVRRKEVPPDSGQWAWPVPDRHVVLPSAAFEDRRRKVFGKKRKEGEPS
jgi:transcriptional regulator with XRE-family HTH domain